MKVGDEVFVSKSVDVGPYRVRGIRGASVWLEDRDGAFSTKSIWVVQTREQVGRRLPVKPRAPDPEVPEIPLGPGDRVRWKGISDEDANIRVLMVRGLRVLLAVIKGGSGSDLILHDIGRFERKGDPVEIEVGDLVEIVSDQISPKPGHVVRVGDVGYAIQSCINGQYQSFNNVPRHEIRRLRW